MRIEELTAGLGITLYITVKDGQPMAFESKIIDIIPKKRMVLADAIIRDGKVLSFKGNGISVDVVAAIPDEKPILFRDITVEALKMDANSYCYNLISTKEGVRYNRRKNFRCFVGCSTPLFNNGKVSDYNIIIRDVSATGFAVTCENEVKLSVNQSIHVRLEDYLEETDENFSFHLYGIVVREQELEHGKTVYGCRLTNRVVGLENYLIKKERFTLRKNRTR